MESERTRGRLEAQARQIADIEQRLGQGETETQALETRVSELAAQLDAHARTLAELEEQAGKAREALAAKAGERETASSNCCSGSCTTPSSACGPFWNAFRTTSNRCARS